MARYIRTSRYSIHGFRSFISRIPLTGFEPRRKRRRWQYQCMLMDVYGNGAFLVEGMPRAACCIRFLQCALRLKQPVAEETDRDGKCDEATGNF
ncbi:hypothetical protein PISMIDRAFT_672896 [Pisolithus microcarpus 441]|uniref:Uncharacterized protein n=1 Tax=Pisolithus microcarpus 441 TaxID=765257 RepID=A0A0D0A9Q8_9AGAM|nr:hypothetical protein PISMIDRAFT_672896 [Pisolithus microcarpus 441]